MNFIKELEEQISFLNTTTEITNRWRQELVGAFAAMIIEEWCLANGG